MEMFGLFFRRYRKPTFAAVLVAVAVFGISFAHWHAEAEARVASGPQSQTQAIPPLSPSDVSWLFPAPSRPEDFANLIAVNDLTTPNLQDPTKRDPVWPDAVFQRFVDIASSPAAQVAGRQI